MRELKLKYFIDLVSNVGAKAQADAQLMQRAQETMNAAIVGTNNKFLDYNKLALLAGKNTGLMQEVITGATNKFVALERAMDHVGRNTSLERQVTYAQRLASAYDTARTKAAALRQVVAEGLGNAPERFAQLAGGYYGARAAIAPPLRAYSTLEAANTDLRVALMTKGGQVPAAYGDIQRQAVQLGNRLPGTTKDYITAAIELASQGVSPEAIIKGGLTSASHLGVLLNIDRGQAAETVAKIREAYGLHDDELPGLADIVQRNKFAFGLNPEGIRTAASYSGASLSALNLRGADNMSRILTLQGMANQAGMDPSSFGTNFAMMLSQLVKGPLLIESAKKGMKGDARQIMEREGIHFDFFDKDGHLKQTEGDPIRAMVRELSKLETVRQKLGEKTALELGAALFGQEAARPAMILGRAGEAGYLAARNRVANQATLDERIDEKMSTFASKLEALGGTVENVQAAMAKQLGEGLKPVMDKANEAAGGPIQGFFDRNPSAGTAGLLGGGALSAWLTARFGAAAVKGLLARVGGGAAAAGVEGALGGGAAAVGGAGLATVGSVVAAGGYDLWQAYRLFGGLKAIQEMKNRQGVTLSPYAKRRLAGQPEPGAVDFSQIGGDFMTLTAPGAAPKALQPGADIKVGEGRLDVNVRVFDDRVTATTSVAQPLSLVRINQGSTNPAGYDRGTRGGQ